MSDPRWPKNEAELDAWTRIYCAHVSSAYGGQWDDEMIAKYTDDSMIEWRKRRDAINGERSK